MASPTPPYTITRATLPDAEGIFKVLDKAFATNPLFQAQFPPDRAHLTSREDLVAWQLKRTRARIALNQMYFKVTPADQPDLVVGYAHWFIPGYFAQPGRDKQVEQDAVPECVDVELQKEFEGNVTRLRKEIWGKETNYWYLAGLAVHPDYQRQGIAEKLLEFGLQRSDEEGVPIYLVATPDGTKLYLKHGFETRGEISMLGSTQIDKAMVREAKRRD